jgi:hypothetical protein
VAGLPQPTPETKLTEFYRQLQASFPIVDGRFVDCSFVVADGTTKAFKHGLGRAWRGAFVVCGSASTGVFSTTNSPYDTSAAADEIQLRLSVAADVTLRVWVF